MAISAGDAIQRSLQRYHDPAGAHDNYAPWLWGERRFMASTNGSARFRHLLIRDAAYDSIPKEGRAETHEAFARWLERAAGERQPEDEVEDDVDAERGEDAGDGLAGQLLRRAGALGAGIGLMMWLWMSVIVILVGGVSMLIFGELEWFFPMAVAYVSFGLFRAGLLGLLDRRQGVRGAGWVPGGLRETDVPTMESVGEEGGAAHRRRRRRRRSGRVDRRNDRDDAPPSDLPPRPPTDPSS